MGKKKFSKGPHGQKNQPGGEASGSQTPSTSQPPSAEPKQPKRKDEALSPEDLQKLSLETPQQYVRGKGRGKGEGSQPESPQSPIQQSPRHGTPEKQGRPGVQPQRGPPIPAHPSIQQQSLAQGGPPPGAPPAHPSIQQQSLAQGGLPPGAPYQQQVFPMYQQMPQGAPPRFQPQYQQQRYPIHQQIPQGAPIHQQIPQGAPVGFPPQFPRPNVPMPFQQPTHGPPTQGRGPPSQQQVRFPPGGPQPQQTVLPQQQQAPSPRPQEQQKLPQEEVPQSEQAKPKERGQRQKKGQKQQKPQREETEQKVEPPREPKKPQEPRATKEATGDAPKKSEPKPRKETSPTDFIVPLRKKLNCGGTLGRPIMIETNHLALSLKNLKPAIHYDVVLEPDKPKKLLRLVMEQFRKEFYPTRYPAFDGTKNLYSSSLLPFGDQISGDVKILEDEREKTYKVKVKYANEVDLSCLVRYFESAARGNIHMVTPQEAIQCIDIVLRNAPSLHCIPVGRSFFTKPSPQRMVNLGEGMEMYHGFYQSAVLGWKPFLNVDVSHKAFPKEMPVLNLICELLGDYYRLEEPLVRQNFEAVDKFMRTLKVKYEIPNQPNTKRVMRVNQLDQPANQYRFKNEEKVEMTVSGYFERVKGIRLRYPHLPCLWVGSRQREPKILLPMEFCTIMDGQVTNRAMTPNQTSNMIRSAATSTNVRKDKIMSSIRQANYGSDRCAQEFGISVNEEFTKVKARVLPPPRIKYCENIVSVSKGVWRADRFCSPGVLDIWSIVCLNDRTKPQELQEFAHMMTQQGRPLGMSISQPQIVTLRLTRGRERQTIEQEFQKLKSSKLILVVIPDIKDIYNYVKQAAELTVGVITQCVKSKNLFRPKPSTVGNILLKVNAKLNGLNHVLASTPACLKQPCMIMGADVTHPSPESRGTTPSVAAVTASHDRWAFKYNITCRLQQSTQEIITDLANIVREHLTYFELQNKIRPSRIIFFRDGVSEGQFEIVVNSEVQAVRKACHMIDPTGAYKPKLTFLVVQKRHHTRFFPTNPRDSEDRNNNVPAGTVVDTEITHPTALDFYLVSHASIQGVARPTKYRKLWDENEMQEDELEELTFHLCHMFARCTRSVSYPAPTYYAHLAAARAKVYCERQNINMNNLERAQEAYLNIKTEVIKGTPMYFV